MAGTLELSKDMCWMPAGWIYDNALEGIAERVSVIDPDLHRRLRGSLTDINGGYLDLQECDADQLATIKSALVSMIATTLTDGPSAMHDPSYYEGYVQQLRELDDLLEKRLNEVDSC